VFRVCRTPPRWRRAGQVHWGRATGLEELHTRHSATGPGEAPRAIMHERAGTSSHSRAAARLAGLSCRGRWAAAVSCWAGGYRSEARIVASLVGHGRAVGALEVRVSVVAGMAHGERVALRPRVHLLLSRKQATYSTTTRTERSPHLPAAPPPQLSPPAVLLPPDACCMPFSRNLLLSRSRNQSHKGSHIPSQNQGRPSCSCGCLFRQRAARI
jgi:hypothetical protein